MSLNSAPRPAATVILLRDGPHGLETLMLKRNQALMFAGGIWVFPGGAIDAEDRKDGDVSELSAARRAAVREAFEESGLLIDEKTLVNFSLWITPQAEPKRFHTWFFIAPTPSIEDVLIDNSEIVDHAWIAVNHALSSHEAGELGLFPPTLLSLKALAIYDTVEQAMTAIANRKPYETTPILTTEGDGDAQIFFAGDAAYTGATPSPEGPRHRCILRNGTWHYLRSGLANNIERLDR
jgi:8-oxo-dGTP pyrophosphatase MutT (NUDIX family)